MEILGKVTAPETFGVHSRPLKRCNDSLIYPIRECLANARTYKASEVAVYIIRWLERDYLLVMHNGAPFQNLQELLRLGVTPNVTAGDGVALHGTGLAYTASYMSVHAQLIVASFCRDDGRLYAARGSSTLMSYNNEWAVEDVSKIWRQVLEERCGPRTLAKYTVFYAFALDLEPKPNGSRRFLTSEMFSHLSFIGPEYLDQKMKLIFGEKQVGFDEIDEDEDDDSDE